MLRILLKRNLTPDASMIETGPLVYTKSLLKVFGKLSLVTEENLVQPNLCFEVPTDEY
jgi:hypothetical protein